MKLGRVISMKGASILFSCLGTSIVFAQSTEPAASDDKLEEVVVTGYRESLEAALDA